MIEFKTEQEKKAALEIDEILSKHPVLADPKVSPFKKRLAAMQILKGVQENIRRQELGIAEKKEQLAFCEKVIEASKAFPEWQKLPLKLEKNDCSRLHHLVAFLKAQDKYLREIRKGDDPNSIPWEQVTPFVVQHDWAAAFKNAGDYAEGSFTLPYEMCAFEFRISGRSVTVLGFQGDEQEPRFTPYIQFGDYWVSSDEPEDKVPAHAFAISQIKAICVALDAEVATRSVVRASEALNKKRVAEGRIPLYSYHVVNLNRRYRISNPSGGGSVQGRRRLHFRRGHWRHYEKFKTWVRWTLVGNPELGFIDKEYRL